MKKGILSLVAASIFSMNVGVAVADSSEFCQGFERGYITGYKRASGSSFDPFTPYCPFQPFKAFNDPQSDFEQGYVIGFEKGMQEGHR